MGNQDCSGQTNMTPNQNSRMAQCWCLFAWVRSKSFHNRGQRRPGDAHLVGPVPATNPQNGGTKLRLPAACHAHSPPTHIRARHYHSHRCCDRRERTWTCAAFLCRSFSSSTHWSLRLRFSYGPFSCGVGSLGRRRLWTWPRQPAAS